MNKKIGLPILVVVIVIGGITVAAKHHHHSGMAGMSMSGSVSSSSSTDAVASNSVAIQHYAFSPKAIKIKTGTTVTWTNQDNVHHTVTIDSGADGPTSNELGQGQTYSYTFKSASTFNYHCKIHPDMHGSVLVES